MAEKKLPLDQQNKYISRDKITGRSKKLRIFKISLLILLVIFLTAGGVATAVVTGYINEAPPIDISQLETVETSYLYDSEGEEITALHDEQNRVAVTLDDIPEHVQQAFIAIEDERFKDHIGFDITASLRAAYANFRAGRIVQGASTITQQLAQNAFLTTETSYERKLQEIWLAIQLERIYSKEEILELYLNRIYFGSGAYGVEAAALTYFDKSVSELDFNEAAMLAGIVRSPNYFNPFNNQPAAERRMRIVLANMHRLEHISDVEYRQALEQDLTYGEPRSLDYPFPHYVDYVLHNELLRILTELPGIDSRAEAYLAIYTGGLRVYTNLDTKWQSHVEYVISNDELFPATYRVDMNQAREALAQLPSGRTLTHSQMEELVVEENGVAQPQAAIVLADPITGRIKALGGGREYQKNIDEVLRFYSRRQPGSAIKPIISYAPAFEEGILAGAGSTIDDSPYKKPELDWFPENYDFRYRGMLTAREALYKSFNIPAVRIFEELGPQKGSEYAERMGISTFEPGEMGHLSLTLGGFTHGVRAIDMTQAFSVLANDGLKVDLHTVEKIVDRQGNILYEYSSNPEQILSPQTTFLVNDILQDYVNRHLGSPLRIDRPVAAKSGTTDKFRDAYLVAYTPNIVASLWMGYDEPRMGQIRRPWSYTANMLREVILEVFNDLEVIDFERPEGIVSRQICDKSGLLPNDDCYSAETVTTDYFIEGRQPTATCDMHVGRFYNRPPFIITDERWSGEPGRGPEDIEETDNGLVSTGINERHGFTTDVFTRFNAYVFAAGITLRWDYDGPGILGFELTKTVRRDPEASTTIDLDKNLRHYIDDDVTADNLYTYTLTALYTDGTVSDSAQISLNIKASPEGEITLQPYEEEMVIMPDVVGSFQSIAEANIKRAGLVIGEVEYEYDDEVMRNRVISQRPAPGSRVVKGRETRLVVSR